MNKSIIFAVLAVIFVGIGVSRIKYEVVFLRKSLKNLDDEIEKSQDSIKVLTAEWGCLNNPSRLKKLASKYLPEMKSVGNSQIVRYKDIVEGRLTVTNNSSGISSVLDGALGSNR
jgi:cell division protein FtsL